MKLYQCSKCKCLCDGDDHAYCNACGGGAPQYRTKESAEICRQNFEPLNDNEIWHEPFYWENNGLEFEYFDNHSYKQGRKSKRTQEIILALMRSEKQNEIAKRFGVTKQYVSRVKRKYVDGNDKIVEEIRKELEEENK